MMQSPLSEFRLVQLDGTAGAQTIATASINIAAMDCNVADAVLPLLHHATSTNIGHVRPTRRKSRPSKRPGRQRAPAAASRGRRPLPRPRGAPACLSPLLSS